MGRLALRPAGLLAAALLLAGCGERVVERKVFVEVPVYAGPIATAAGGSGGAGGDVGGGEAGGGGGSGGAIGESCDPAGPRQRCFATCCADVVLPDVCIDGAWVCEPGTLAIDDPSCIDANCACDPFWMLPGEACDEAGNRTCNLTPETMPAACEAGIACRGCEGFTGPVESGACRCECIDDAVHCTLSDVEG
ncbi:hypothetical protein [Vulgatibacter sp.]|uniref:hypothetical protein n=1 Tax=Vulgatibacter sp. TaxID=1971226 RepID=UPI0035627FB3